MRATIEEARERIETLVVRTPCRRSGELSRLVGSDVYLKLENLQTSGSFKLRGVANRILSLTSSERRGPLIAASTGNHGAAFCHVVKKLGLDGRLFLPTTAAARKLEAIQASGIPFELVGDDCVETEDHARQLALQNGYLLVPPYNNPAIVAGQGTVALELYQQLPELDTVLVPVGGGGLISGIGAYLKETAPQVEIVGCQPRNSSVMFDSVRAGRIVTEVSQPTLSDATAGGIEGGSITLDLCRRNVDHWVLLTEEEIAEAIRIFHEHEKMTIEGAAALTVAAVLKERERFRGKTVALIVTGSKIDEEVLRRIL